MWTNFTQFSKLELLLLPSLLISNFCVRATCRRQLKNLAGGKTMAAGSSKTMAVIVSQSSSEKPFGSARAVAAPKIKVAMSQRFAKSSLNCIVLVNFVFLILYKCSVTLFVNTVYKPLINSQTICLWRDHSLLTKDILCHGCDSGWE